MANEQLNLQAQSMPKNELDALIQSSNIKTSLINSMTSLQMQVAIEGLLL